MRTIFATLRELFFGYQPDQVMVHIELPASLLVRHGLEQGRMRMHWEIEFAEESTLLHWHVGRRSGTEEITGDNFIIKWPIEVSA